MKIVDLRVLMGISHSATAKDKVRVENNTKSVADDRHAVFSDSGSDASKGDSEIGIDYSTINPKG